MWYKYIFIFSLFYFFALLQNSFFVNFSLLGTAPNLVFVLFFSLVFFSRFQRDFASAGDIIFYAVVAGLFLDIFSSVYFGVSMASLLLLGLFVKKTQSLLLENKSNNFPFVYFLPVFLISLAAYDLVVNIFISNFKIQMFLSGFTLGFAAEIFYNICVACLVFLIFKRFFSSDSDARQLKLFNK